MATSLGGVAWQRRVAASRSGVVCRRRLVASLGGVAGRCLVTLFCFCLRRGRCCAVCGGVVVTYRITQPLRSFAGPWSTDRPQTIRLAVWSVQAAHVCSILGPCWALGVCLKAAFGYLLAPLWDTLRAPAAPLGRSWVQAPTWEQCCCHVGFIWGFLVSQKSIQTIWLSLR